MVQNIRHKKESRFVQLDIVDFYPSISEELLIKSLEYAQTITAIDAATLEIIMHSRKSLLFSEGCPWIKKDGSLFDVTIGSYDEAEVCELVGLFLLHQMKNTFPSIDFGLYRDDGLGNYKRMPGPQAEKMRKNIIKLFKENSLRITIVMNECIANFLDATLNLTTGKHAPYKKPNDTPLYIHKQSNHPPNIIKQIPSMIETRLSDLSSDPAEFTKVKEEYAEALSKSGFTEDLEFKKSSAQPRKNRKRNIIWFNPPFNQAVTNNIGREFNSLIEKHFPTHHRYRKLFNRSNVRLSYSCTQNVRTIIDNHNKKILSSPHTDPEDQQLCNCANKSDCPLDNQCMSRAVVYKGDVSVVDETIPDRNYIGLTEPPWKGRYSGHKTSFKKEYKRNETTLSQHIWKLKDRGLQANIKWSIQAKSFPYRCGSRKCDLCLTEKLHILKSDAKTTLNSRSELVNKCRHALKFKLTKAK